MPDDMEKETAAPPLAEDTASTTDVDEKEPAPPNPSEHKKSLEIATSSVTEPSKTPEKVSDDEKSDDEYPHGLALYLIMLGLCLAVFLIAIGKDPSLALKGVDHKLTLNKLDQTIIVRCSYCGIPPSFLK